MKQNSETTLRLCRGQSSQALASTILSSFVPVTSHSHHHHHHHS